MSGKTVSKIISKRTTKDGKQEYLFEYKINDKTTEEWKTSEDISSDFEKFIDEFNRHLKEKATNSLTNGTNGVLNGDNHSVNGIHKEVEEVSEKVIKSAQKPNGFDRGFRPFKILGAKNDDKNGLMFLVMFREDMTTADLIPNHILHQKCPQLLIKYYEKNTLWKRY